jgi:lysozyme
MREINIRGLELIKHFESLFLKAYRDEVGVWTIGWGHTGLVHEDGTVYKGRVITKHEAEELLRHDMHYFEKKVEALLEPGIELTDDQFSALVSFAFNVGDGNLAKSTLLRKLNSGDIEGAANEFKRWNRAGGQVLKGLTRRRLSEENLFRGKTDYIIESL